MEGVRCPILFVFVLAVAGCSRAPDAPFPDWLGTVKTAHAGSSFEASKTLLDAALDAEREAGDYLGRVSFTPAQKTLLIERLREPVNRAVRASRESPRLVDRSTAPFETLEGQPGFRMIGRSLAWQIDRLVATEEYGPAVHLAVDATQFGFALGSGSASDAALGLRIVDEARLALAPALGKLSPRELRELGTGLEAALRRRPAASNLIENERRTMLAAVQTIQDAYRDRKLGRLIDELGRDIEPAIDYLENLRSEPSQVRAAYFEDFAAEAEAWVDHFATSMRRNARQRDGQPDPPLAEERPWRRFSRHFFQTLAPLVLQREETVCRTRLLALNALIRAEVKVNGEAPGSLTGISADLTTDPYSGKQFLYRPEGSRFLLYSVGADLRDDGGETDETHRTPDVRVEGEGL